MNFNETLVEEMNKLSIFGHLQITYNEEDQRIYIDSFETEDGSKMYYGRVVFTEFQASIYKEDEDTLIYDFNSWIFENAITAGHIYNGWDDEGRVVDISEYAREVFNVEYSGVELDRFKEAIRELDNISQMQTQATLDNYFYDFDPFPNSEIEMVNGYWQLVG